MRSSKTLIAIKLFERLNSIRLGFIKNARRAASPETGAVRRIGMVCSPTAQLQTFLNDQAEPVQSTGIDNMIFSPEQIVSYISQVMTLLPGDVILTGTPAGIGPLSVGDQIRIEIEGIGCLENRVVARV